LTTVDASHAAQFDIGRSHAHPIVVRADAGRSRHDRRQGRWSRRRGPPMAHSIFISLAEEDTRIAEALRQAFNQLLGDSVEVYFSTSEDLGGIRPGEDWYEWIVQRVLECDFALILLTPASIHSHWVIWEAGAVYGASLQAGTADLRKVRPLRYQLEVEQLPSPMRDSKIQSKRGDLAPDVTQFLMDIADQYRFDHDNEKLSRTASKGLVNLHATVQSYLAAVAESLMDAPALATSAVIEEWRIRLDQLLAQNRPSEAEYLHDWMDIAFGRSRTGEPLPLDLRLHSRLADLYLKAKKYDRAIQQLQLARTLAPRDIYVLRTLGRAYLECNERSEAKAILDRIEQLDAEAVEKNVECAALAARWHREGGDRPAAAAILDKALARNGDSYYLANLLGEIWLEHGDRPRSEAAFQRSLSIIDQLEKRREANVWTNASAANAAFVLGQDDRAAGLLRAAANLHPDSGAIGTIERGLRGLAARLDRGEERVLLLIGALRA
jgi:tetratricopeptide (TPR) repeat protein